ncbi:g12607 [Coccomyxa viridis]|uniref:Malate dehydrogenase n=1 Tax=Coccomyxa viridis TaxID=1274662 RepID=A0ABP1GAS3_9CHLO
MEAGDRVANLLGHLNPVYMPEGGLRAAPTSASSSKKPKVAVLGAAGGIGQPLALLLKGSNLVGELSLYDIVGTEGVAADLSHIDSSVKVSSATGADKLGEALYDCDLVVIPAGVPRKPGMTRDDLFNINAGIVANLCAGIAKYCPGAWVAIISNPVNSTVPIAAEVFKKAGTYDPRKLLGVTKLDVLRANTFVAEAIGKAPESVSVPVIGGHAGVTILPLLSQTTPRVEVSADKAKALTERIQDAGTEVVKAKAGKGSATLSMAYAAAKFAESCLLALQGQSVVECAYVESHLTDLPFFASQVRLGRSGVEEYLPLGSFNELETKNFGALKSELRGSIQKGVDFVHKS